MTWDKLCERADGVPYGHPALLAKDEARWQIRKLILYKEDYDIEDRECPEEEIENFLAEHPEYNNFDERGNLMSLDEVRIGSRETAYMLEVMEAFQNGETIESLVKGGEWEENDDPHWNWDFEDYRVKRKKTYHVTIEKIETTFLEVEAASEEEAEEIAYDAITPADFPPDVPDYRVTEVEEI